MTAEPRDVEELVPRNVEEIAALVRRVQSLPTAAAELVAREFIADRLTAADRENAELRGEVERLRWLADDVTTDNLLAEAHDEITDLTAERDDLRAQLAAAQVQLAEAQEAIDQSAEVMSSLGGALVDAEARLEAVRALCVIPDWPPRGVDINGRAMPSFVSVDAVLAALSAAPQPEPDVRAAYSESLRRLGRADLVHNCVPEGCSECRPECRHCNGSGNAHTFDGDELGICGTCHGTGSAAGGGL